MAEDSPKKVDVVNDLDEKGDIKVKKSRRWVSLKGHRDKVGDEVAKFYNDKEFGHLQRPVGQRKGLVWLIIFLAVIFGLISGTIASFFILTHESVDIPFYKKVDLTKFFPAREISLTTEKNITVMAETRIVNLAQGLASKTLRFFKAKPEQELGFLEQIYAPWQTTGFGVVIAGDGWLITSSDFEKETDYIAIDQGNKIFQIEDIIQDPVTKISFLKISGKNLPTVNLAEINEVNQGQQAVILDRFKNLHLTEISQPQAKHIYKTEDLVCSTDKFSDYLRLDAETSIGAFPNGLVFGFDGAIIGLISQQKVIPAWQIKGLVAQVSNNQKISRPYLGLDYLPIDKAPGLTSPRFKDLSQGAIVYGPPADNSPAFKAGIKNADVIVKINDLVLDKDQDLTYLIQEKNPGEEIKLTVLRQGEEIDFKITLEELGE